MGVALTPIVVSQPVSLESLAGRTLAVDGNAELYQFLALIRLPDGTPLMGSDGRVTSHLVGTDFNEGVRGVGPKKALKLVRSYGAIEAMPEEIRTQVPESDAVRSIYRTPEVTSEVRLEMRPPDEEGIVRLLCGTRRFSESRVRAALERLRAGRKRLDFSGSTS